MIGAIIAKRKVRSAYDSLNRRDLSSFLANWREDATFIYYGAAFVSGRFEGKKAIGQFAQKYWEQFPKWNITVKNIMVQNIFAFGSTNVVAVEWDLALTDREGRNFQESAVSIIRIKRGKAVLVCDYKDPEADRKAWGENKV
ncbi:MAG: nuclear transport factor 2 family protein [Candidatus Edwardsbacteria bacterium]